MIILGIDPGASGGIAVVRDDGASSECALKHLTLMDQWRSFQAAWNSSIASMNDGSDGWNIRAYIEHVHSMPGQGVASTFKFGRSYGNLEAFLTAAGIPFERVSPSVWQREFGLIKRRGETKTAKKNRHKALAQELFPGVKVTHAVADALLIAEYGRRQK